MSRTLKTEWSTPEPWSIHQRIERRARPAGRLAGTVAAELAELDEFDGPGPIVFEPVPADEPESCSCSCRRCALHDDCGGCLVGHASFAQL